MQVKKIRGLRVLPNKLKIDKKRSRSPRAASSIFRKCPYTYCACYKRMIRVASVKLLLSITFVLYHKSIPLAVFIS